MATYNEQAHNYATNKKNEYLNSLSYLTEDLAAQNQLNQQALTEQYNILFNQINRQQEDINKTYAEDAQAAYLNKLMAGRALDESLSQLGLSTGGFGIDQRLANETAYGQNLAALQRTRSEGLQDVAAQLADARGQYNVAAAELGSDYLAQLLAAKQQQQTMGDKYYNNMYTAFLDDLQYQDALKQQELENKFKQEQFDYQKQQDAIANAQRWAQINGTKGGSGGSGGSKPSTNPSTDPTTYNNLENALTTAIRLGFSTEDGLNRTKSLFKTRIVEAYNNGLLSKTDADKLGALIDNISYVNNKSSGGGGEAAYGTSGGGSR